MFLEGEDHAGLLDVPDDNGACAASDEQVLFILGKGAASYVRGEAVIVVQELAVGVIEDVYASCLVASRQKLSLDGDGGACEILFLLIVLDGHAQDVVVCI